MDGWSAIVQPPEMGFAVIAKEGSQSCAPKSRNSVWVGTLVAQSDDSSAYLAILGDNRRHGCVQACADCES